MLHRVFVNRGDSETVYVIARLPISTASGDIGPLKQATAFDMAANTSFTEAVPGPEYFTNIKTAQETLNSPMYNAAYGIFQLELHKNWKKTPNFLTNEVSGSMIKSLVLHENSLFNHDNKLIVPNPGYLKPQERSNDARKAGTGPELKR